MTMPEAAQEARAERWAITREFGRMPYMGGKLVVRPRAYGGKSQPMSLDEIGRNLVILRETLERVVRDAQAESEELRRLKADLAAVGRVNRIIEGLA